MPIAPAARFSSWSANSARLLLAAIVVIMLLSAIVVPSGRVPPAVAPAPPDVSITSGDGSLARHDADLLLYERIVERVAAGESYYDAAISEQRARSFPVRPGFAVRMPALAWLQARIGGTGTIVASILLLAAIGLAWWRRLADEGAGSSERRYAVALVLAGSSFLLNSYYHPLHELWAGGLMALALGLHRPGRYLPAVAVAALALAIRELVLPFVLLMGAMAAWRRDWKEATAWGGLVLCFAILFGWHLSVVAGRTGLADHAGPSWLTLRGLPGWIGNIVQSSQLHLLPRPVAAPLLVLALLGWAGRRTLAGTTATLLLLGYGVAFMIAGRDNNFYWGLIVTPLMFAGLAFIPMSLSNLWQAAARGARHS